MGGHPTNLAVVVFTLACGGLPCCLQMASTQRGWWWWSHCLCWPMVAVAGFVRGCTGSNSGGGHLAASHSASAHITGRGVDSDVT